MPHLSTTNIAYDEYTALNALLYAHREEHAGNLRAAIVFGDLVATGGSRDLQILEVVDGWNGRRHAAFTSTAALPLRGQLHLYFLTPEEFENPQATLLPEESWSSAELLDRVRQAYAIVYEAPSAYALNVMVKLDSRLFVAQPEIEDSTTDPFTFLRQAREDQAVR